MKRSIQSLMDESGVKFGTSGARGLVTELTDRIAYAYTRGFLQFLADAGELPAPGQPVEVLVGGDLRPSTPRIMDAVLKAVADAGHRPVSCGRLPSPAVALAGFTRRVPSIMVTGSHIPDDRNGIKFNKCSGEVLKEDEGGITRQEVEIPDALFKADGGFATPRGGHATEFASDSSPVADYLDRYVRALPEGALRGLSLGVYQHSAVARDVLVELFTRLGAEVTPLGRSETFLPVDTEAIRDEDVRLARDWGAGGRFDAIVSADGDSDRPLISDERGEWLRGDIAGVLCARFLGADSVSTPVSCNTAVEKCGWFREVRRTRIGSPFVVASMQAAAAAGARCAVGYEANGGFLLQSSAHLEGRTLGPLPTRDAVIVILGVLLLARRQGQKISQLAATLPGRHTASDRLKEFPTEQSRAILRRFDTGNPAADLTACDTLFARDFGPAAGIDRTDGVRVTLTSGEIIHLRPSGNAPEFRCYTEAASEERTRTMNTRVLQLLRQLAATMT